LTGGVSSDGEDKVRGNCSDVFVPDVDFVDAKRIAERFDTGWRASIAAGVNRKTG